jgi:hypothetical protein
MEIFTFVLSLAVLSPLGFILMDGCIAATPVRVLFLNEVWAEAPPSVQHLPTPRTLCDTMKKAIESRGEGIG